MQPAFKDHFSGHAALYARYRPVYPDALFAYLAALPPARRLAWDCGTGNGQAALALARHFDAVVATDASARQLAEAPPHPRVAYHVAPAEAAPLADASADLVTVAQALHWFDFDGFNAEARRVLRPGGYVAVWGYAHLRVAPDVDAVLERFNAVVANSWPPERRYVDDHYRGVPFPFDEVTPPAFAFEAAWTLDDVAGYLRSWSATQRYVQAHGADPVAAALPDLQRAWGAGARTVRWPLFMRVGRRA